MGCHACIKHTEEGERDDQLNEVILSNLGNILITQSVDNTGCFGSAVKLFQIIIEMGNEKNRVGSERSVNFISLVLC